VTVLWIKSLHIVFMVTWYAGLFYLPRLFVYHAMAEDAAGKERFKVMERKLYWGIMAPGALLTIAFGAWLWSYGVAGIWFQAKLGVVALTLAYHAYCGKLLLAFARDRNAKSHLWYRWFNEVPVVFLIATVVLAVVKPF
jgi:putative membrane protein